MERNLFGLNNANLMDAGIVGLEERLEGHAADALRYAVQPLIAANE